jgi:hypothetical protein
MSDGVAENLGTEMSALGVEGGSTAVDETVALEDTVVNEELLPILDTLATLRLVEMLDMLEMVAIELEDGFDMWDI